MDKKIDVWYAAFLAAVAGRQSMALSVDTAHMAVVAYEKAKEKYGEP